jgi:multiple sugar transport system ATP-binding protein
MAPITFEHLTKRFDETTAVDDLNIEVADGEFLVLVGPSGCGKTTALRMVAGLEDITSGRILIGDRVVNNVAPGSRDVAMVFQSYALYPHMTVYDNLAFSLRNHGVKKKEIDERVRRTADVLELGELLKRKPKQLSGWRSAERSCASPRDFSWTSRSRISTRPCACRRAPRFSGCRSGSARRPSTSRTTRSRR